MHIRLSATMCSWFRVFSKALIFFATRLWTEYGNTLGTHQVRPDANGARLAHSGKTVNQP